MLETKHIMISGILEEVASKNNSLEVRLNDQEFVYYSHFYSSPSMEREIHDGKRLLIAPLDPPIGNIKIIQSAKVTLEFFTSAHLIKTSVKFLSRVEGSVLSLSYPTALDLGKQRRSEVRISVDKTCGVIVKAIYPEGISFLGPVINLSKNGICFASRTPIANIEKQSTLKLIIIWGDKKLKTQGEAEILSYQVKEGGVFYYARFWLDSFVETRSMKKILSALQESYQVKRAALFGKNAASR